MAYRFQKAFRRNKLVFAAASAVAAALMAGIVVSSWQAVRATRAEKRAKGEAVLASRLFFVALGGYFGQNRQRPIFRPQSRGGTGHLAVPGRSLPEP